MRILYITDYLPYPLIAGDLIRNYNLICCVAKSHQVSIVGFQIPGSCNSITHLEKYCEHIEGAYLPNRRKLFRLHRMFSYLLSGTPYDFEFLYSKELIWKIKALTSSVHFDIIQIEHSRMALYREAVLSDARTKHVLTFHNVASHQYDRIANIILTPLKRARTWLYSRMLRRWEPYYAEHFDRCIAVSTDDRNLLLSANPRLKVAVIPNGIDTRRYQRLPMEEIHPTLLMVGSMSYLPNVDGAIWFCHEILPIIKKALNNIQILIVGSSPSPEVTRLDGNAVCVIGQVDDVIPYYKQSAISIVPLRAGGGTRLKVLEAMALGRPIVSTTIGCEGLDVVDGEHLLIADHPEQFAEKIVQLLTKTDLYRHITQNARQLVEEKYDWKIISEKLLGVYSELAQD